MSKEKLEEYENKIVMQEKSKLQREAENYLNQNCKRWESDFLSIDDIAIENYLAGAEPREKKIKELEKGCEETQELLDKQIEATYKLDKENAELKSEKGCETCTKFDEVKLTKATELLKGWLGDFYNPKAFHQQIAELVEQSEQFIKEVKENGV